MVIEGYIEFENEIPVSSECLGQEYPIIIAGIEGLLTTPRMYDGFSTGSGNKLGPLRYPEQGNIEFRSDFNWGSVNSWPDGLSSIRACKLVFHDIDKNSVEQTGIKIAQALHDWRNLLIDNISLTLVQDYRGTQRASSNKTYGLGEFGLFRQDGKTNNMFIPEEFKSIAIKLELLEALVFNEQTLQKVLNDTSKGLIFDKQTLQQILNNTSKGKAPLLPFYFLFDAESAKSENNFRKSILDSATAVEVCFSFLISKLLSFDENVNKYNASKYNSLRLKRALMKVLNVSIPIKENEFKNSLDNIRNKVIHAGYFPTKNEANTAYKIAQKTLYTLLPNRYEL